MEEKQKRIEKVDENELAIYTTDAVLGALVASLVTQGVLQWEISSPGDVDQIDIESEESVLFWARLIPAPPEQA